MRSPAQINIATWKVTLRMMTKMVDRRKPKTSPMLDLEDHAPTKIPSFFMLKCWLKIANVAGKRLNWKNPYNPKKIMNIA